MFQIVPQENGCAPKPSEAQSREERKVLRAFAGNPFTPKIL